MSVVQKFQINHQRICPFKTQQDKLFFNSLIINSSIFHQFCPFKAQPDKMNGNVVVVAGSSAVNFYLLFHFFG